MTNNTRTAIYAGLLLLAIIIGACTKDSMPPESKYRQPHNFRLSAAREFYEENFGNLSFSKLYLNLLCKQKGIILRAQTSGNYYKDTDKISGKDYVYSVSINKFSGYIELQNTINVKSKLPWYYKGTSEHVDPRWVTYAFPEDKMEISELLKEVFTKSDVDSLMEGFSKNNIPPSYFNIQNIITLSGEIEEVIFTFYNSYPYTSIHPDKLHTLEQKMKEKIRYKVLDILKSRFDYIRTESIRVDFSLLY